jgi:hypothetical protein
MPEGVLDKVERSLEDFQPRTQREFVALQVAQRFGDLHRLARYLTLAQDHPKRLMLEAARRAMTRHGLNRTPLGDLFFEVIAEFDREDGR